MHEITFNRNKEIGKTFALESQKSKPAKDGWRLQ